MNLYLLINYDIITKLFNKINHKFSQNIMAGSLNKVQLIGRLGADPEIKQMVNGKSVARLSIATSQSWKDKSSGCLLYTSPSPRDATLSRMPSSA